MTIRDFTRAGASGDLDVAATTGTLLVYLGVAPGAGATCAMIDEAKRLRRAGTDVVAGFIDCHGRAGTLERAAGLEVILPKTVGYGGARFDEMDTGALIARRPAVALVDELAHGNVPGCGRHAKRWEDVLAVLAAGIDVITTVDVQQLDSVAGAIERLTGRSVNERVPDWVVRRAGRIELVDCSPQRIRRRILRGDVFPGIDIPRALAGFFMPGNLDALRQLGLRFIAGDTEQELLEALRRHEAAGRGGRGERLMVAVTPQPGMDAVVRRTWRTAARTGASLHVVHICNGDATPLPGHDDLATLRSLAVDLGATWIEMEDYDTAEALIRLARQRRITRIVLGSGPPKRWHGTGGPFLRKVLRLAPPAGIDVHVMAMTSGPGGIPAESEPDIT